LNFNNYTKSILTEYKFHIKMSENIELKYIPEFVKKKTTMYDNNKNLSDLEKYRNNLEIIVEDYQKLKNLLLIIFFRNYC
jgi:hypothetical protein